jgi:hypothetical protein
MLHTPAFQIYITVITEEKSCSSSHHVSIWKYGGIVQYTLKYDARRECLPSRHGHFNPGRECCDSH